MIYEPAIPVSAVDTTGAGDVFRAAFIHAMLQGEPPHEMLRFANAAADWTHPVLTFQAAHRTLTPVWKTSVH